jgi:hypothetical protein
VNGNGALKLNFNYVNVHRLALISSKLFLRFKAFTFSQFPFKAFLLPEIETENLFLSALHKKNQNLNI